jgi:proton-translocating NAD(P)+ transhydrogenase subunit alpha
VPAMMPVHASEMYAKNLFNFMSLIVHDGALTPDWEDEIVTASVLTRDGKIQHELTRERVEGTTGDPS